MPASSEMPILTHRIYRNGRWAYMRRVAGCTRYNVIMRRVDVGHEVLVTSLTHDIAMRAMSSFGNCKVDI